MSYFFALLLLAVPSTAFAAAENCNDMGRQLEDGYKLVASNLDGSIGDNSAPRETNRELKN